MENIGRYLISATIYGSITGIIILMIKSLIKNYINKKYAYLLWMILIIKLIIPFGPESSLSLFNKMPVKIDKSVNLSMNDYSENYTHNSNSENEETSSINKENNITSSNQNSVTLYEEDESIYKRTMYIIWICGFFMFIVTHMIVYLYFMKDISKNSNEKNKYLEQLIEECKVKLHIKKNIQIKIVDIINSPSVVGVFKIRILIPRNLIDLSEEELQHIFLHELSHYKSKDTLIDNLLVLLQSIHWFNPLIYYFFKLIRNDMEMACDERVLSFLDEKDHNKYGLTMLTVLERMSFNKNLVIGLNMTNDKKTIKKRVNLIKNAKHLSKKKKVFAITGITCTLILSGALLTNGKTITDDITNLSVNQSGNDKLDKAISNVIINYHLNNLYLLGTDYQLTSEFNVESHVILGKEEDEDSVEVYLIATYGTYGFENDIFNMTSGSYNVPIRIKFSKVKEGEFLFTDGGYYYLESEEPDEGEMYESSVRKIFPKYIANKILNSDYTEQLNKEVHMKAEKYAKNLGRESEVSHEYVEKDYIDEVVLQDLVYSEELYDYPDWIGTREQIEKDGKRYIYETNYDKSSSIITYTKYDENKTQIESIQYKLNNNKFEKIKFK